MTLDQVEQRFNSRFDEIERNINNRFDQLEEMIKELYDMNDERLNDIEPFLVLIERTLHNYDKKLKEVTDG